MLPSFLSVLGNEDKTNGGRNLPRIPMKVGNITRRVAGEPGESACPGRDTGV